MPVHALIRHADRAQWLRYSKPLVVLQAAAVDEVANVIGEAEHRARRDGLHAVGLLTYEAAAGLERKLAVHAPGMLPPAWFALFATPTVVAEPGSACQAPLAWRPTLDAAAFRHRVARVRDYISAGDTYQVNFSYRLRAALHHSGPEAAEQLFRTMISRQPAGLGAFIQTEAWAVCCASHELFFARRGRRLTSRPMKGTAPRGATDAEDAARAHWLQESPKNRAENLMITDMVRNDIGRLADIGSVHTEGLFRLEAYPTLWQMTSTVHGDTGASLTEILRALFPAASITGAPKRRTMEIIRELEPDPREIYTGTVGTISPDGDAQFNVAIRTALVDKRTDTAEYGVGGAILWDSDPDEELQETVTKARILYPAARADYGPAARTDFALLETLLWEPGHGFLLLREHLVRLQTAACQLFHRPLAERQVRTRLDALAAGLPEVPHRVRLLVDERLDIRLSAEPLDPADRPRTVVLSRSPSALLGNPFVQHKTTRRDVYDAARASAGPSADDVLLQNQRGEVTESTIANLVIDLDGTLVTPPVSSGLLPGVYRQHLLDTGTIVEQIVGPEDLRRARAIYLANSVRGLWQVELIEDP